MAPMVATVAEAEDFAGKVREHGLKAGVMEEGTWTEGTVGTPQGAVISPLLANIYLNPLDHQINESNARRHRMVRYADDFVVLSPAGQSAGVRKDIESWLEARGLTLHTTKTRTVNVTRKPSASSDSR